jgi:hypothetical protein
MRWRLVRNSPRGSCGKELKYAFDFFSRSYGNKFKDKERFFGPDPRRVDREKRLACHRTSTGTRLLLYGYLECVVDDSREIWHCSHSVNLGYSTVGCCDTDSA